MERQQALQRGRIAAECLPGEVLERVLAHASFRDRINALAVCRTWHQHLAQPGLLLWQAASLAAHPEWREDDNASGVSERKLQRFLPLHRWLWRNGRGLLQLQCSTSFDAMGNADDGLTTAFLATLAATAPALQALRLDTLATWDLGNSSLVGIASMGSRLRQLALLGLQWVSDESLMVTLAQLPKLQDLAILYTDQAVMRGMIAQHDEQAVVEAPDTMRLLACIAVTCPALRTLALGHLPTNIDRAHWSRITLDGKPLPAAMSRLSALSSLLLHNVGWEHAPGGLPHLPKLRRLSLRGDSSQASREGAELQHQLSSLTALEALQVMLPDWPGRLPTSLTQLVMSPLDALNEAQHTRGHDMHGGVFLRTHLPPLQNLRHLAFHGLGAVGGNLLKETCGIPAALPQLVSLHLVACSVWFIPPVLCELPRLQLLNLSHNVELQRDGYSKLAGTPLHKLTSCRRLDLRCKHFVNCPFSPLPLHADTQAAIAAMPALEQLALPIISTDQPENAPHDDELAPQPVALPVGDGLQPVGGPHAARQEETELAQRRGTGMPPIRVVTEMPESDRWGAVDVDLPFAEVNNDVLGVQLDRSIARGVHINM